MDHKARLERLQKELRHSRLHAVLITSLANVRYLCGFTGSAAALLVSKSQSTFFTDGRYSTQARDEVQAARIVVGRKAPLISAAECLRSDAKRPGVRGSFTLGIEAEHVTVADRRRLAKSLALNVRLGITSPWIEKARIL